MQAMKRFRDCGVRVEMRIQYIKKLIFLKKSNEPGKRIRSSHLQPGRVWQNHSVETNVQSTFPQ